ncbi:carbon-monoxide dehydrogenase medium subunit [Proteiniborus ethanoligenes]|uniref:Carbon-monoxide dehydrogenase medium subunit n=1 Tax=Proteiniborus ethanoligenes TaxID=415015 RepID=A0A1H3QZ40_9FIRM|nr:xanthine dehydrogenase family protein subunit M [Proteiniborus ethanoligenes]SDZ18626.1 carbon-monoxide dehydrogenase medium subunit [Proteiniborus ethanoligenes]
MKKFNYFAPKTVEEAVKILAGADKDTQIIAGGTDFIVQVNKKMISPEKVVDIKHIKELAYVREENEFIKIGALTNFSYLESSEILNKKAKALAIACGEVGSIQIRNLGTIGGNIVNASAAGDSIAALMALDASVVLKSEKEERTMKLEEFYRGSGDCQIRKDEILTEIFFKAPSENSATSFKKLGKRKALAIVVISIGALIEKDKDNICTKAQISLGAISRYPVRVREVEEALMGKELNRENIEACIEKISEITNVSVDNSPFKHLALYKGEAMKGIAEELFDDILADLN